MRIDIVVVYVPRYQHGHEKDFVPPITGIHLAALTPAGHQVRLVGSSRVDLQACKLEYSIVSPK